MQARAREAERNVTEALGRVDTSTEERAIKAEARAMALQTRLERLEAGLRSWVPEEEWAKFEQ